MRDSIRYINDTIISITRAKNVVIYGAGTMGRALGKCLQDKPYNLRVLGYLVKNVDTNPDSIDGVTVYPYLTNSVFKSELVLIALNEKLIPEVRKDLEEAGYRNVIAVAFDGDIWTAIRSNWMRTNGVIPSKFSYLAEISEAKYVKPDLASIHLYVINSIYDKCLMKNMPIRQFEIPIQVGAALTDKEICAQRDNINSDNISLKNKRLCEWTGIYWAWKNDDSSYIGFSHYRRRFLLDKCQIATIMSEGIDVVVTYPIVNFDTVIGQYTKDHCLDDWMIMSEAIRMIKPEYYESFEKVQSGIYYFAYNMFIMEKSVFKKYCEFAFPILEYCDNNISPKEDTYQNRAAAFLSERLLSVFIEKNQQLKVSIADKTFLE